MTYFDDKNEVSFTPNSTLNLYVRSEDVHGKNRLFPNFWSPIAKMMVKTLVSKTACVELLGSSLPQWNLLGTVTKATLFWNRN